MFKKFQRKPYKNNQPISLLNQKRIKKKRKKKKKHRQETEKRIAV